MSIYRMSEGVFAFISGDPSHIRRCFFVLCWLAVSNYGSEIAVLLSVKLGGGVITDTGEFFALMVNPDAPLRLFGRLCKQFAVLCSKRCLVITHVRTVQYATAPITGFRNERISDILREKKKSLFLVSCLRSQLEMCSISFFPPSSNETRILHTWVAGEYERAQECDVRV